MIGEARVADASGVPRSQSCERTSPPWTQRRQRGGGRTRCSIRDQGQADLTTGFEKTKPIEFKVFISMCFAKLAE